MKRHIALFPLSHHHQHVLVQAKRLSKVSSSTTDAKRAGLAKAFLNLWIPNGVRHFRDEEEILLPAMAIRTDPGREEFAVLSGQHLEIRSLIHEVARSLETGEIPSWELLSGLGQALEAHVRFEEHVLFPLAESILTKEDLVRIERDLRGAG